MPEARRNDLKTNIAVTYGIEYKDVTLKHILETLLMSTSPTAKQAAAKLLESIEKDEDKQMVGKWMKDIKKNSKKSTSGQYLHGKMIVKLLIEQGGDKAILDLITKFRENFVGALSPQHLPESWSVLHAAERKFGEHSIYTSESQQE